MKKSMPHFSPLDVFSVSGNSSRKRKLLFCSATYPQTESMDETDYSKADELRLKIMRRLYLKEKPLRSC